MYFASLITTSIILIVSTSDLCIYFGNAADNLYAMNNDTESQQNQCNNISYFTFYVTLIKISHRLIVIVI